MSSNLVPFNFEYDDKFCVITKFTKLVGPMRYSTSLPVNEIQSYPITVRIVNTSEDMYFLQQQHTLNRFLVRVISINRIRIILQRLILRTGFYSLTSYLAQSPKRLLSRIKKLRPEGKVCHSIIIPMKIITQRKYVQIVHTAYIFHQNQIIASTNLYLALQ